MQEEQEGGGQEPSECDEDNEEGGCQNWRVTHGWHMVRGKMHHGMEDYVVAKKQTMDGKELGLFAIFDGHTGRDVAEFLQHHLLDNILSQVNVHV